MTSTINELKPIRFKKDFSYNKQIPTFVSNNIGGSDEIARWVLDLNGILYKDEPHAPLLSTTVVNKLTGDSGPCNSPVLIKTDALIYTADSIVQYLEQKCVAGKRLIPADPAKEKEVLDLYSLFTGDYEYEASRYFYSMMLPNRSVTCSVFTRRIPWNEKLTYRMSYPSLCGSLQKEMDLAGSTPGERLAYIQSIFKQVDSLMSDGRKYLTGNTLTLADIAFAAISAPLILPDEFGGVMIDMDNTPDDLRKAITELRTTPAGQFVLRLYHEDRPTMCAQKDIPKDPHALARFLQRIQLSLGKRKSNLFYFLQKRYPVLKFPFVKLMTVNKNDLLTELLTRDEDFTVEEINAKKMSNQKGAFFLGMDRMNPQFDRERNFVRKATKKDDLDIIRNYVRSNADDIVLRGKAYGRLDVADDLCFPVLVRLIDFYFGVPAPSEAIMRKWLRALFYDLFLNFTNNEAKHQKAVEAALARKDWILVLVKDRKQALKDGKILDDNILNRLIIMQQEAGNEWFDDDALQRNIGGLLTGILETTNKATILVLDELFNRPDILKGAIDTAKERDMKKMYGYVSEALRFNPAQPGVIRYSEKKQTIKGNGTRSYTIPAKTKVFALTSAAMFDPAAFPNPKTFNPGRTSVYMNYGFGLHECYGKYINAVTISEFTAAVLRLKNVRRLAGRTGQGTGLHAGPFPNNFVVAFEGDG
jgi:cytochrome P450/glutathione S-transferase